MSLPNDLASFWEKIIALIARSVNRSKTAEIGVNFFRFFGGNRRKFDGLVEKRWIVRLEREIPRYEEAKEEREEAAMEAKGEEEEEEESKRWADEEEARRREWSVRGEEVDKTSMIVVARREKSPVMFSDLCQNDEKLFVLQEIEKKEAKG